MTPSTRRGPMFDNEHLQRLYRYCFSLTANEADAYDLLQDGIERFLSAGYNAKPSPDAYIYRILRNRFVDQYRQAKKHQELNLKIVDLDESSFDTMRINNIVDIENIWSRLDPIDREVLYFWAYEGYSTREVAEKMELPKGTILSRLNRIQHKVSAMLEPVVATERVSNL